MTDRHRSQDGTKETDAYVDDAATPAHHGRAGGNLERQVGTRDLLKQTTQDKPGATRVRKSDEQETQ